jgi:hypothetical protein
MFPDSGAQNYSRPLDIVKKKEVMRVCERALKYLPLITRMQKPGWFVLVLLLDRRTSGSLV